MSAREPGLLPLLAVPAGCATAEPRQPVVGVLIGLDDEGRPAVQIGDGSQPFVARTIAALAAADIGQPVVLLFEAGDAARPIVAGVLRSNLPVRPADAGAVSVTADGERVTIEAAREITLRCGEASITLTRAGKVLIRGAYVSSSAAGMNRVTGATVRLN